MFRTVGVLASTLLLGLPGTVFAQDAEGSADHPLVSRFEGSTITHYEYSRFDEYRLVTGPIHGYRSEERLPLDAVLDDENSRRLEGGVTLITYSAPAGTSSLAAARAFQRPLEAAGFEPIFSCSGRECQREFDPPCNKYVCNVPERGFASAIMHRANMRLDGNYHEDQRFYAARLRRPEGDVYVSVLTLELQETIIQLDVIEVEPMADGLVAVDAGAIREGLEIRGSYAFTDVLFDPGSYQLSEAAEGPIRAIAHALNAAPDLRIRVVGHTDDTGSFDVNMELSLQRAQAIVAALEDRFEIGRDRVVAHGVGPLAPVASNATPQGRARNRRVVLVASSDRRRARRS